VRERIVAAASGKQIILVGPEKLVAVLGSRGRLPVEVVPFGLAPALRRLGRVAGPPTLRALDAGRPFVSDNGNLIVDCAVGPIADPARLERELRAIPGVVDTGLFLGTADTVLVGEAGGVREVARRPGRA
jgi:ribose 5-phosphate isomerase A